MRLVWLVALVASVAVIVGGVVGNVSSRREHADERDEALRATTALTVAHVDAELTRISSVLQAATGMPGDATALLGDEVNVCSVASTTTCSHDEPAAPDDVVERAARAAQQQLGSVVVTADGADVTDGVIVVSLADTPTETLMVQIATRELLSADASLLPSQPLGTPRLVDGEVAPDHDSPVTRDDQRIYTLGVTTEFDDGARYVVASAPADITLTFGQSAAFAASVIAGGVVLLAALMALITQARRLNRRATTDDLTGLIARREFERLVSARLDGRGDHAGGCGAVIFVDLDEFKRVNDHAGHHVGDAVLREVASALTDLVDDGDIVARWGGDEFALFLAGADGDAATALAEDIEVSVRQVRSPDDGAVSCSVGVAVYPAHGHTVSELLQAADASMYVAKRVGHLP